MRISSYIPKIIKTGIVPLLLYILCSSTRVYTRLQYTAGRSVRRITR